MTALLRYAYLKSLRDHSLIAFIGTPALVPVAALLGVTLAKGQFRYPMYLEAGFSPFQNAVLAAQISTGMSVLFTVLAAFWTLRTEIATRSIGSFLFAVTPLKMALTLVLFAAAIGVAAFLGSIVTIGLLTAALPPALPMMALIVLAGCLAASALGTLMVTISPQPAMIIGSYLGCMVLIPWIAKSKSWLHLMVALAVAIVCTALSSFLLERRCAT